MPDDTKIRNEQLAVAARHAAGVGLGWFTLTLLARQVLDAAAKNKREKYHDRLKAYVNARYPAFTPDFDTHDDRLEKAVEEAGIGTPKDVAALVSKTAADQKQEDPGMIRKVLDKFINPIPVGPGPVSPGSVMGAFGSTRIHPAHIAMTLAAALGGTAAGMAVSKKISASAQERELDARIAKAKQELDQLTAEEYVRTRGLSKTAAAKRDSFLEKGVSGATKLYLLYAAGVAALTYGITKKYMDENDPNRSRLSSIQDMAKDRARMSGAPQILEDPSDPTYQKLLAASSGNPVVRTEQPSQGALT